MKKTLLLMLVLIMVFTFAACGNNTKKDTSPTDTSSADTNTIKTELTVWGMTCSRCVNRITRAVSALDGVKNVSVDLRAEKVTVEHEPELDVDTIKNAVTAAGYDIPLRKDGKE